MTHTPKLATYLQTCRAEVDEALERFLPNAETCPEVLAEAMRYSVLAGGKRFRPVLTLMTADAIDEAQDTASSRASIMPVACAIEFIHTYSLVHDDLPAMDDDTLRRGRATTHMAYGEGLAILAGDGLLTQAFHLLTNELVNADRSMVNRQLKTIRIIAEAAGAVGMVGGQAIDLEASSITPQSTDSIPLDSKQLRGMHARKTGALIRAAAVAGSTMAGATDSLTNIVDQYATHLGLAFQIVDDILDVEGAVEALGKTVGKDASAGKTTYPSLYGVAESRRLANESVERAHEVLRNADLKGYLPDIASWVVTRSN